MFSAVHVIDTVLHISKDIETNLILEQDLGEKSNCNNYATKPSKPPGMDLEVAM